MTGQGTGSLDDRRTAGAGAAYREPGTFSAAAQRHELTFYPGGRGRLDRLLRLVDEARHSIRMCFYIFADDATGRLLRDALTRAASRGVDCTLVIDSFGSDAEDDFFAPFNAAGGKECKFSSRWTQRYLIRNHQKIVVVDDTIGMVGGFNVEDDYFAPPQEQGWSDLAIVIEGRVVADLVTWFDRLAGWTADPKAKWKALRRIIKDWEPGDGPVRLLVGGPTKGLSSWASCVGRDLARARRLDMVMAYFSPPRRLLQRIGRIACDGEARLILAGKSDNAATIGATRLLNAYLLKKGAAIWEFDATKLHTKLIVLDDAVYFGSANFDMRSLYLNLELMLRIEDAALAERMRQFVDTQMAGAREITPAIHACRATLWNRMRWSLSWLLVSVLDYTVSRRLNLGL
ncbi:phospholipase D-like domain-containing protein [Pseudopontixanthobacter vadosimaris]|uniref:phospholipase D-like domain-containing protein n=1 Tax=Pseudopontixanthobacter vadosimaris TaxID=2726450 RepID=UPI001473FFA5|nr:phosphatidylserine/phosphatidylglycerophosphate/cardiolipin synthase family protein [Pseudopontixanthobacter vadosimaris]